MTPHEIAMIISLNLMNPSNLRLLLAGPCDVGKSEVAKSLVAMNMKIKHIEQDQLKNGRKPSHGKPSPCSIKFFDIEKCFSPEISGANEFILDTAGNNIFRKSVNNQERLKQLLRFKNNYGIKIAVLTISYPKLKERFNFLSYAVNDFEEIWNSWEKVEKPYWKKCADLLIDVETGNLTKS